MCTTTRGSSPLLLATAMRFLFQVFLFSRAIKQGGAWRRITPSPDWHNATCLFHAGELSCTIHAAMPTLGSAENPPLHVNSTNSNPTLRQRHVSPIKQVTAPLHLPRNTPSPVKGGNPNALTSSASLSHPKTSESVPLPPGLDPETIRQLSEKLARDWVYTTNLYRCL
jgi:hypothetical protein